ncbi:glutathione S-transferase [Aspergillus minisclerotigenes]|uniref:Glutathione S-transferase n=1 Tax=Aspergillus minisclerotigenes TaxID=656917 RepID=A0A5N6J7I1_9EURO|nr:glutathione S-transferase [Aspergillus minisclerotigenes]
MSSFYTDKTPDPVKNAKGIHLITSLTPNGRKVHILLEELKDVYGLEWTTSLIDPDTKEQKKKWFLKLNPNGRIPILIDNTRSPPHPVMESSAELLYLVSSIDKDHQFWFSDPIEQSEAYQWLIFWHASGQPIQGQYNYFRRNTIDPHATTRFRDEVLRIYQVLEAHLSGKHSGNAREYLAGPGSGKYSIVDINAWAWIRTYRSMGFSEDEIAAWPSLGQWVDRIAERPAVQRGLGEWYDEDVHPELVVRTE